MVRCTVRVACAVLPVSVKYQTRKIKKNPAGESMRGNANMERKGPRGRPSPLHPPFFYGAISGAVGTKGEHAGFRFEEWGKRPCGQWVTVD
jgi:hypothetical protein